MADRYTITERVDQGGMAEVFRGVAEGLKGFKKNVAIKRILPNLTKNKKFVSMFLDEARLSLHLQHANIVHVFDIGVADSSYFIVMEYVDGVNLKTLIEYGKKLGRPLRAAHTLWLMGEVCKGLAYAHDARDPETGQRLGIVHRDISPPNILVSKEAEVKLVDFGLAKATSQIESTDPGVVKGKFSYLSPEAASGLEVDHRADIFAVGILLWEMLSGKRLFYGETDYQTVELVRQARVPSLQALNPEVDADLDAVVRKALARDPRDRYQNAGDLQEALAQVLFSRAWKVTSRDIKHLVAEAIADREKTKPKPAAGSSQNLIDALILDEMQKFTSIEDDHAAPAAVAPEQGGKALDPGAFVDTSGWADEVDGSGDVAVIKASPPSAREVRAVGTPPNARVVPPGGQEQKGGRRTGAQSAQGGAAQRGKAPAPEVESLQQILEPDRTGVNNRVEAKSHAVTVAVVIALLLAGAVGGALFAFKDRLFGAKPAPTAPAKTNTR
jgi:serine/threonine-protein kinase